MPETLNRIAEFYLSALKEPVLDPSRWGAFIHDNVTYTGPNRDGQGLAHLASALASVHRHFPGIEQLRVFVGQDELCVVSEAHSADPTLTSQRIVDWIQVREHRISSVSRIYDARTIERITSEI